MRRGLLSCLMVLGVAGCMEIPKPDPLEREPTLYTRLGGEERIRRIVTDFVAEAVVQDGLSRKAREQLARPDEGGWAGRLVTALAAASGGPKRADATGLPEVLGSLGLAAGECGPLAEAFRRALIENDVPDRDMRELTEIFERACRQGGPGV